MRTFVNTLLFLLAVAVILLGPGLLEVIVG